MYLDVLDLVGIEVRGEGDSLRNYLQHEYSVFVENDRQISDPDIVVNLVEDVSSEEETVHVRGPVSYDGEGVYLQHRLPDEEPEYNAFRIDFDALGQETCHVTCDRGFNPHFFGIIIDYLIHYHLLKYGSMYCHSCAFEYDGKVIVCPAWRRVGKTNLLLSFLEDEVTYIADDWCVLRNDGTVQALPKRLNLLYYNFKQNPDILGETSDEFEALVDFVRRAETGEIDLNQDAIGTLSDQARMRISPYNLFPDVADGEPTAVDYIIHLRRSPSGEDRVSIGDLSREVFPYQMQSILEFEQSYFHTAYQVHKTQHGGINSHLEDAKRMTIEIVKHVANHTPELHEITAPTQQDAEEVRQLIKDTVTDGR